MSIPRKMAGFGETDVPDGSQEQPILVNEDHDVPQSGIGFEVERLVQQVQKGDARFNPIDLDGEDENLSEDPWRADEDNYDDVNAKIEREALPNEPEDTQDGPCVHWKKGIRNPCPCGTHQKVPKLVAGSIELTESQVVELKESVRVGRYEAEFVEVHGIWVSLKGDNSFIRGRTYARTRNLEGRIEPCKNEVCEIYELDENDHCAANPVTHLEQALVEVPILNIKTIRTLHKTNKAFPECRFDRLRYRTKEEQENEAPLTCRWRMVLSYPDPRYRRRQRPIAGEVITHYSQNDIPKDRHRIPDNERRKPDGKIRGGSFIPNGTPKVNQEDAPIHRTPGQKYTVFDTFSGAGGYSKGAEMAGFKVLAACDYWARCCETYRQNFPDAELHQEDVYQFIEDMSTDLTREHFNVDVLHFSPPCQTWSPAHTCEGKKDEENRAALFACEKIITIFKPRIFTVEQTFGLAQDRWIPNFNALVQGFTRHGYSVRWKVLHLVEYGLPQTRKRLVMIGAAPGEELPTWPQPTHSKDPKDGQKPLVSASKACSVLVEGENLHDVEGVRPADKVPWDSSTPLKWTITCSAGQCYHWSGRRGFTLAELAALQGFPVDFRFVGKCIKKQIGNAFAPIVVKVLLKGIRVHLENFDGVTRQPAPGQIIIVNDDDNDNHTDNRQQPQHKELGQSRAESQLVVEDLVGLQRKPSDLSAELLHGLIKDVRENPVQCFLAKPNRKSSRGDSSSGAGPSPGPRRSSRRGSRQTQPTQRNTLDSYFPLSNDQDYPTATNAIDKSDSKRFPQDTADTALLTADDDDTATQDVTAGISSAPLRIPSTSDESTTGHANSARQTIRAGRTITSGIITGPPGLRSPDSDEPRARRSAQTAATIADLDPSICQTRSSTSRSQTIADGVLSAPNTDTSDLYSHTPMARRSARTARTIADVNQSPRQTRSGSSRSTGHRSARNAQTLAGINDESSTVQSTSRGAATRQPPQTGRIIGGVLTAPRRQSPPGFNDTPPLYQAPRTTQSVPNISQATRSPVPHADQGRPIFNNSAPSQTISAEDAIAGVIEAARQSRIFPGLAERLQNFNVGGAAAVSSPGIQSRSATRDDTPMLDAPTPQSGLFEGAFSSSTRQAGIRAALAAASQNPQGAESVAGPTRRRSSADSVAYVGESSRAGARPSLPFVVEDREEDEMDEDEKDEDGEDDEDEDEDEDEQLHRAIRMSMGVVAPVQEARGFDAQGFDMGETARAYQASMLEAHRPGQDHVPEDLYGPGDSKGKCVAASSRKFDDYAENGEPEREGKPSKRARGRR